MSAELDLMQVQVGKETVWGTPVAATAKLMNVEDVKIGDKTKAKGLKPRLGSLAPLYYSMLNEIYATAKLNGFATYEDVLYWIEGMFGEDTTVTGAGPYVRGYTAPATATVVAPRYQTLIYGNTTDGVYKLAGVVPTKFTLSIDTAAETKFAVEVLGKQVTTGTLAALSNRTNNPIMGNDWALYIDAWAGTIGTTAVATTAFSAELTFQNNINLRHYLGSLTKGAVAQPRWTGSLKISADLNATSKAFYDAMIAGSAVFQKQVRLKATQGTNILSFDFAGFSEESPEAWNERDGVATMDINLVGQDNTTLGNWLKADSTNSVNTLA
jgi:hypothetical protein